MPRIMIKGGVWRNTEVNVHTLLEVYQFTHAYIFVLQQCMFLFWRLHQTFLILILLYKGGNGHDE